MAHSQIARRISWRLSWYSAADTSPVSRSSSSWRRRFVGLLRGEEATRAGDRLGRTGSTSWRASLVEIARRRNRRHLDGRGTFGVPALDRQRGSGDDLLDPCREVRLSQDPAVDPCARREDHEGDPVPANREPDRRESNDEERRLSEPERDGPERPGARTPRDGHVLRHGRMVAPSTAPVNGSNG